MNLPKLIPALSFRDSRGELYAFSTFDLKEIVRMYAIEPINDQIIRAWQGHLQERKWFWAASGSFEMQTIPIDQFGNPDLTQRSLWELKSTEAAVLAIPGGYLNGFRALEESSRLLVFSDFDLQSSKDDDIRFSLDDIPWIERS